MGNTIASCFSVLFKRKDTKIYYSLEEIDKHKTTDSMWIVSNGKVYDITQFYKLYKYPDGREVLHFYPGGSDDSANDNKFYSKNPRKMWKNYLIGYVKK